MTGPASVESLGLRRGWHAARRLVAACARRLPAVRMRRVLVGASPAARRLGIGAPHAAGFYDLAVGADTRDLAAELLARLRQITPPVVPLRG